MIPSAHIPLCSTSTANTIDVEPLEKAIQVAEEAFAADFDAQNGRVVVTSQPCAPLFWAERCDFMRLRCAIMHRGVQTDAEYSDLFSERLPLTVQLPDLALRFDAIFFEEVILSLINNAAKIKSTEDVSGFFALSNWIFPNQYENFLSGQEKEFSTELRRSLSILQILRLSNTPSVHSDFLLQFCFSIEQKDQFVSSFYLRTLFGNSHMAENVMNFLLKRHHNFSLNADKDINEMIATIGIPLHGSCVRREIIIRFKQTFLFPLHEERYFFEEMKEFMQSIMANALSIDSQEKAVWIDDAVDVLPIILRNTSVALTKENFPVATWQELCASLSHVKGYIRYSLFNAIEQWLVFPADIADFVASLQSESDLTTFLQGGVDSASELQEECPIEEALAQWQRAQSSAGSLSPEFCNILSQWSASNFSAIWQYLKDYQFIEISKGQLQYTEHLHQILQLPNMINAHFLQQIFKEDIHIVGATLEHRIFLFELFARRYWKSDHNTKDFAHLGWDVTQTAQQEQLLDLLKTWNKDPHWIEKLPQGIPAGFGLRLYQLAMQQLLIHMHQYVIFAIFSASLNNISTFLKRLPQFGFQSHCPEWGKIVCQIIQIGFYNFLTVCHKNLSQKDQHQIFIAFDRYTGTTKLQTFWAFLSSCSSKDLIQMIRQARSLCVQSGECDGKTDSFSQPVFLLRTLKRVLKDQVALCKGQKNQIWHSPCFLQLCRFGRIAFAA